jgi:hypothetical protein
VAASIGYEMRIVSGPLKFATGGQLHSLDARDYTVIMRVVYSYGSRITSAIVAVIGSCGSDCSHVDEMLNLREFIKNGGRLDLGPELRP